MKSPSYDDLWRTTWGDMQRLGPVHRHVRENLVRCVSALDVHSILDVGCGSGENLHALFAKGGYELTGVDISEAALALARRRVSGAEFQLLNVERDVLAREFDLVMSVQVIEHLADDIAALCNMAEMARSYVFISTLAGRMRRSEFRTGHVRNYSASELAWKLESVGLRVLKVWGWGFPFYSPLYRSAVELLPGGPPAGPAGPISRLGANLLYNLYRLNWSGRGDVLSALAEVAPA